MKLVLLLLDSAMMLEDVLSTANGHTVQGSEILQHQAFLHLKPYPEHVPHAK